METYRSTREAAELLGVRPSTLARAVWDRRMAEPPRSPSGAFLWGEEHIRRAAWVLVHRDLDDILAERGATLGIGRETSNG